MADKIPLRDQIAEIEREIEMRQRVYPHWVAAGKLTKEDSINRLLRLHAALRTLRSLSPGYVAR